jgi:hypothetical protein
VFERVLSLVFVAVVLVIGGYAIARKLHHSHSVSSADRARMIAAVQHREPGAAVMSAKCDSSSSCTVYVRKGATHRCDGWLASIATDGSVALTGIGKKDC